MSTNTMDKGHNCTVKSSEVTTPEFNMEDFGFEVYSPARGVGAHGSNKNYLLFTKKKKNGHGNNRRDALVLSLTPETGRMLNEIIGKKINIGINQKGQLCLQAGKNHTAAFNPNQNSIRMNISMNGLSDKIIGIYGDFRRLYFSVEPYGGFNALILKPTGERDFD